MHGPWPAPAAAMPTRAGAVVAMDVLVPEPDACPAPHRLQSGGHTCGCVAFSGGKRIRPQTGAPMPSGPGSGPLAWPAGEPHPMLQAYTTVVGTKRSCTDRSGQPVQLVAAGLRRLLPAYLGKPASRFPELWQLLGWEMMSVQPDLSIGCFGQRAGLPPSSPTLLPHICIRRSSPFLR